MKKVILHLSAIVILLFIFSSCEKKNHNITIDDQVFSIPENTMNDSLVGQILAPGQTLRYSVKSGNTKNAFSVSESGKITVLNTDALDFETTPAFNLVVAFKNEDDEEGSARITINLINVNPPDEGLLLYLPFNGNMTDASPVMNNGIDFTTQNYVSGKKSQALDFNGTSDYIRLSKTINSQAGLSFSFWINTRGANGTENNGVIISKYSKTNDARCFMVYSFGAYEVRGNNRVSAAFYAFGSSASYHDMTKSYLETPELSVFPDPTCWTILNPVHLITGEWTQCVINVTPTRVESWINGKLCTYKRREYTSYAYDASEPVLIGNCYDAGEGSNNHFNGMLDEFRVYGRTLTNKEIRTLFLE